MRASIFFGLEWRHASRHDYAYSASRISRRPARGQLSQLTSFIGIFYLAIIQLALYSCQRFISSPHAHLLYGVEESDFMHQRVPPEIIHRFNERSGAYYEKISMLAADRVAEHFK